MNRTGNKGIKKTVAAISALMLIISSLTLFGCAKKADVDDTTGATQAQTAEPSVIEVKRGADGRIVLWDGDETPVRATYSFLGCFEHNMYATEDGELIEELVRALENLEIEDREGQAVTTADTTIGLEMADGRVYTVSFTGDSFEEYADDSPVPRKVYETKGFGEVSAVLSEIAEKEKNLAEVNVVSAVPDGDGSIALWNKDVNPVGVVYYYDENYGVVGSARSDDEELIGRLIEALKDIKVGDEVKRSNYDSFNMLSFEMDDGSYYEVNFYSELFSEVTESSSIVYYETEGFDGLKPLFDEIRAQDTEN